ncbi:MAG TPA: acetyl-CoA carboxylase carboxyl transferase subunit alpha, partial [Nitrospiraceae bacterium]|nr:acetyl-CoA carboxylase carboxyl transferase subunit alpha [Nitrospiraceae bacterium]
MSYYLDFEKPLEELETKIEELRKLSDGTEIDIASEIKRLEKKAKDLRSEIFSNLTPWQKTLIARHPERPYTLDYIGIIAEDFIELHGDRRFGDDPAIVGGVGKINGVPMVIIGHQKGRGTKERIYRNFGQPNPEGYRKALRLMKLAERFKMPVITFIDTPGAYPGIGAEERGQAQAIAKNIYDMSVLKTPIICIVIGEGGSGGALALGVGDEILMMEYSVYSVISPEGCASILWKTSEKAQDAADAMGITALRLKNLGLIDKIVNEPVGGAHRDHRQMAAFLKRALNDAWRQLGDLK